MTAAQELALAIGLFVGGGIATGPAAVLLARAHWPRRAPRPALVLWQALCLGAGLSFIGAPLVLALHPLGPNLPSALLTWFDNLLHGRPLAGLGPWHIAAGLLSAIVAAVLTVALAVTFVRTLRRRRAHREVVDLIAGDRGTGGSPDVRVLDHPGPVAYALPGWHARVVLSAGLLDLLTPDETAAVLAHEQAHLRTRDDLLQLPFQTWAAGLRRVPGVEQGRTAVAELAEMLADDTALARTDRRTLASALAKVALAGTAESAPPAPDVALPRIAGEPGQPGPVLARLQRVLSPDPLPRGRRLAVYLGAVALIVVPTWLLLLGWS